MKKSELFSSICLLNGFPKVIYTDKKIGVLKGKVSGI